jgi:glycine betaine/proline transport system substrate-binding protein
MKIVKKCVIAAVISIFCFSTASAAETVVIGQLNWGYAKVMTNVIKIVAEDNYGIQVEMVPGNHAVFFKGMDQGKGEVDVHPEVWLPNNQGLVDKYVNERGTVALTGQTFPAMDAFCTTAYAKNKYGLKSVYDLTRPEIAALTDRDGDGRGEIWMGGPGWKSTKIHQIRARDYGFADLYELTVSEESIILAQIDADAKADRVVVWACYLPHYIFSMHDLVILEEPEHDPEKWKVADLADDANWLENSHVSTAFPPVSSHIAYSHRLETDAPEMVKLLNGIKFSEQLINEWFLAIGVDERDAVEYSREWVDANKEMVQSWMNN